VTIAEFSTIDFSQKQQVVMFGILDILFLFSQLWCLWFFFLFDIIILVFWLRNNGITFIFLFFLLLFFLLSFKLKSSSNPSYFFLVSSSSSPSCPPFLCIYPRILYHPSSRYLYFHLPRTLPFHNLAVIFIRQHLYCFQTYFLVFLHQQLSSFTAMLFFLWDLLAMIS